MAPGRKRGAKGAKSIDELKLGDLVLAKVKGYPAWPAKISRPEDWKRSPDPKKYFVYFFGTAEIAFVAPADVQAFTSEMISKLSARCQGKTHKFFPQAVTEILEEFERLQQQSSSGMREDNNTPGTASTHCTSPHVNQTFNISGNNDTSPEGPDIKLEIKSDSGIGSQSLADTEHQDLKDYSSEDMDSVSPHISSGKAKGLASHGKAKDSDVDPEELTEGGIKKLGKGKKSKQDGTVNKNSELVVSQDRKKKDGLQTKLTPDCSIKESSVDDAVVLGLAVGSRNDKKLAQEKLRSDGAAKVPVDIKGKAVGNERNISRKSKPLQHENGTTKVSIPSKTSLLDDVDESSSMRPQKRRKTDAKGHIIPDNKSKSILSKRLSSGAEAGNHLTSSVRISGEPKHSSNEDGSPPSKRLNKVQESRSTPASLNEAKSGNIASGNKGLDATQDQSPVRQLPTKRRAVRLCDDECDELPKTPIHGGVTNKASVIPRLSDSKIKTVVRREKFLHDQQRVLRTSGTVNDAFRTQTQHDRAFSKALSFSSQKTIEKKAYEMAAEHVTPGVPKSETDKLAAMDSKSSIVSTKRSPGSISGTPSSELQVKNYSKALDSTSNVVQKKIEGADSGVSLSDPSSSFLSQSMGGKRKQEYSEEERKTTPKAYSLTIDASMPGNSELSGASPGLRIGAGKHEQANFSVKPKNLESDVPMKNLIAAAQARKRQTHLQTSNRNPFPFLASDFELSRVTPSPTAPIESAKISQVDDRATSPSSRIRQISSSSQHDNDEPEERKMSADHQASGSPPVSGDVDAAVARDAFEGMIETLSRTKESIGRATRQAVDCAKYGISNEVVELLVSKLENEPSLRRKVDLFFLVDSITQCSHSQKGIAGASYIPAIQAALPRIISSAAPPGASAQENRRQCNKVLRLWLERKILPEFILRQHISDLGAINDDPSAGISSRRPSRAERAFDDPIREMEGMLVDEYGSNATFQLPGLMASHIFDEDDDEEDEHDIPTNLSNEIGHTSPSDRAVVTPDDRRCFVLEDVDGELEMEDVSEQQQNVSAFAESNEIRASELAPSSSDFLPSPEKSPPMPFDTPPESPPLPSSPWPFAPPPPPPAVVMVHPPPPSSEQNLRLCPPPFASQQAIPTPFIPHHRPPFLYPPPPPPLPHEVSGAPNGRQLHVMSSSHNLRGEAFSQQAALLHPSRQPSEYVHVDSYANFQALQTRQLYHSGVAHFPSPSVHSHLIHTNSNLPHQHPPYSSPIFPNDPRRHPSDAHWSFQGYYGTTPQERPVAISAPNSDHGGHLPPPSSRPGMSTGNWRRA